MTRTVLIPLSVAAVFTLTVPEPSQAQFRGMGYGGGFMAPRPFTQADVLRQHYQSLNFTRNGWNVVEQMGRLNYYYGGGASYPYSGPGYGSLQSGSMGDLYKQSADAATQAQQTKKDKEGQRKKLFAEMQYEQRVRDLQVQAQERSDRDRRSRSGADVPEINSGWALNDLLDDILRGHAQSPLRGPLVPLDPEWLAHVNFAGGGVTGGVGLLKADKPLLWPAALARDNFKAERDAIEKAVPSALAQAKSGMPVDRPAVKDLTRAVNGLRDRLREVRDDVSSGDYINALEFLTRLEDSAIALAQPGAARLLDGTGAAKGTAVHEFVEDMAQKGLRFAAAAPGDERYYALLYQAMYAYANGLPASGSK